MAAFLLAVRRGALWQVNVCLCPGRLLPEKETAPRRSWPYQIKHSAEPLSNFMNDLGG